MTTKTRSPAPARTDDGFQVPSPEELKRLKLSPEVAWYCMSRGIPLPACPPKIKTPEPGEVLRAARFDPERVDRVLKAFSLLRHTQGEWAGRPLRPDPWQIAYIIAPVFGWIHKNSRGQWVRVIRELYVDVPRKNGKTTLCGGISIYLTCADGEPGAQVLAAATTKRQAGFLFGPIKELAEKSPALKQHVRALAGKILHPGSGSYFEVISSIADAQHGGNVHGGTIDELHVHKDGGELVEAIETGTGSRRQPLIAIITTADSGKPGTIYDRKRSRIEQLAKRLFKHPSTYGVVWAADEKDDPFAESTWIKANPGYGISPTREYLQAAAAEAQQSPVNLAKFLRLHLGIRTRQQTKYIPLRVWDRSAGLVDEAALEGKACYGGLDLAAVSDFNALALSFPDGAGGFDTIWRFWLPTSARADLAKRTSGESEVWIKEGRIKLTEGDVVDYDTITADILREAGRFEIKTIGYDRRFFANVVLDLQDNGITCVPVPQTYNELTAPTKELLRLLLAKRYRHGGNPVLRWMVDNLAVEEKPEVGLKPNKALSGDKIDGVSAAVNALRESMYDETGSGESIYESEDVEFG